MSLNLESPALLLDEARMQQNIERRWIITDAGWMAMSRDRGTQKQARDYGYGMVCDADGNAIAELAFDQANQEHGVLQWTGGDVDLAERYPIGSSLRIAPNHACATGAQHPFYYVMSCRRTVARRANGRVFSGW